MNGNVRKTLVTSVLGLMGTGVVYIMHQVNKVEPMAVKTEAVKEKLDLAISNQNDQWRNQQQWNNVFLQNQQEAYRKQEEASRKQDEILQAVKAKR